MGEKKTLKEKQLVPYVYNYIQDLIFSLKIKSGEKIPEEMIVKELGISRTPVREALHRLSNDGLINIYPRRFSEVITLTEEDILQLATVRIALDSLSVQLAIQFGSNAEFMQLEKLIDECVEAENLGNLNDRIKKDTDFHLILSKISKNKYLYSMQKSLILKVRLLLAYKIYENPKYSMPSLETHYKIIKALYDRDDKEATRLMQDHMMEFYGDKDNMLHSLVYGLGRKQDDLLVKIR
ncbi:MAG: GntR family transcriptional regulator, partial [Christensenellales bacterium]